MIQETAEGLRSLERTETAAANEEFTGVVTRLDTVRRENGWDPFEVWRTRVRATSRPARARKDRPRDPRR